VNRVREANIDRGGLGSLLQFAHLIRVGRDRTAYARKNGASAPLNSRHQEISEAPARDQASSKIQKKRDDARGSGKETEDLVVTLSREQAWNDRRRVRETKLRVRGESGRQCSDRGGGKSTGSLRSRRHRPEG